MQSINIIGSNGKEMIVITEDKIKNLNTDFQLKFDMLIQKYIDDPDNHKYLLDELTSLFDFIKQTDQDYNFIDNINTYVSLNDLYIYLLIYIRRYDLLKNLFNCTSNILKKLYSDCKVDQDDIYIQTDNIDLIKNIHYIISIIKLKISESAVNDHINLITTNISNLSKSIYSLNTITLAKPKYLEQDDNINIIMERLKYINTIDQILEPVVIQIDDIINTIINSLYELCKLV